VTFWLVPGGAALPARHEAHLHFLGVTAEAVAAIVGQAGQVSGASCEHRPVVAGGCRPGAGARAALLGVQDGHGQAGRREFVVVVDESGVAP